MPVWNVTEYGAMITDVFGQNARMYEFYISNVSFEDDRVELIAEKLLHQFIEFEKASKFHDVHLEIESKIGTQQLKDFSHRNFSEDQFSFLKRAFQLNESWTPYVVEPREKSAFPFQFNSSINSFFSEQTPENREKMACMVFVNIVTVLRNWS